jgi:hypothetical protein
MNKHLAIMTMITTLIIGANFGVETACTPAQVQTVNTVVTDTVDFAEFGCVMASPLMKSQELVLVCGIVKTISDATPGLLQFIDTLIEQREMLKKNGMMFDTNQKKWMKAQ